ncbi:MAG TPA: hypothetical protein VM370_02945 [Candidatus Thermoplasmatota archaeon]|nr:hypothetical protein [Candidatus Thermoplasmatota archaeon]
MKVAWLAVVASALALAASAHVASPSSSNADGTRCAVGELVTGIALGGAPYCEALPMAGVRCQEGSFLVGFDDAGAAICGSPTADASDAGRGPDGVAPDIALRRVLGLRNASSDGMDRIWVLVAMLPGGSPTKFADARATLAHAGAEREIRYGFDGGLGFNVTMYEGVNESAEFEPGDLAEMELLTWPTPAEVLQGEHVELTLHFPGRAPLDASFTAPASFEEATRVLLRGEPSVYDDMR